MLYPFLTAPDETEISYSEVLHKTSHPEVRVFVEKWDTARNAFDSLELYLPSGRITQCVGFSKTEAQKNITHILHLKDVIWECAEEAEDG